MHRTRCRWNAWNTTCLFILFKHSVMFRLVGLFECPAATSVCFKRNSFQCERNNTIWYTFSSLTFALTCARRRIHYMHECMHACAISEPFVCSIILVIFIHPTLESIPPNSNVKPFKIALPLQRMANVITIVFLWRVASFPSNVLFQVVLFVHL